MQGVSLYALQHRLMQFLLEFHYILLNRLAKATQVGIVYYRLEDILFVITMSETQLHSSPIADIGKGF